MASTLARGLIGACLAFGPLLAHGDPTPARLSEGEYSMESLLQIPEGLEQRRYDVHCEVRVQMTGRPRSFSCYGWDGTVPRKLIRAVSRAGMSSRFVPATRDGEPVEIYMVLMVRVAVTNGESLVLVLPNNGTEHERYGLFYIAPQRFNEFSWSTALEPYFNSRRSSPKVLVWQEFWIDEHGKVTDSRLTNASGATPAVIKEVSESAARMQFMPGFVEGKPVAMHYMEPAYSAYQ
jgi:hypothetical protein